MPLNKQQILKRDNIIKGMLRNKKALVKLYGPDAEIVMYKHANNKVLKPNNES